MFHFALKLFFNLKIPLKFIYVVTHVHSVKTKKLQLNSNTCRVFNECLTYVCKFMTFANDMGMIELRK